MFRRDAPSLSIHSYCLTASLQQDYVAPVVCELAYALAPSHFTKAAMTMKLKARFILCEYPRL